MNGQYYLIQKIGTKYKFYWAPVSPWPKRNFDDWGVAVVDFSWRIADPRPKHLRAKPLDKPLQPAVQVLRDVKLDGVVQPDYRYMCLKTEHLYHCLKEMDDTHRHNQWISG